MSAIAIYLVCAFIAVGAVGLGVGAFYSLLSGNYIYSLVAALLCAVVSRVVFVLLQQSRTGAKRQNEAKTD